MSTPASKKLLIAGGGTGGHVFSGLAVAEEWAQRSGEILFVGTARGMEFRLVPTHGYRLETIGVSGLKGMGLVKKLRSLFKMPSALWQSWKILRAYKPDMALGIGGYASGPTILMAWFMCIPCAVLDQNSMPGLTNKWLGRIVKRVFLTFDDASQFFKQSKIRLFGNPVIKARREGIVKEVCENTLLICGGSQGARALNDLLLQALPLVQKKVPQLKVIHQTGVNDFEKIKAGYEQAGIVAEVAPFFDSMNKVYQKASLIVSRAGAGTLTEIALWGLPAILIPFPEAADDHQRINALHFVRKGAALMMSQNGVSPELLAQKIIELMTTKGVLEDMGEKAKQLGCPNAAEQVVSELLSLTKEIKSAA